MGAWCGVWGLCEIISLVGSMERTGLPVSIVGGSLQPREETEMEKCLRGVGGTGAKSSLVQRFLSDTFHASYDPTIRSLQNLQMRRSYSHSSPEDVYQRVVRERGVSFALHITDTAGQEEYASIRHQWISENEAFIVGYAINNYSSFERLGELPSSPFALYSPL